MSSFAEYILNEPDLHKKIELAYYLHKKKNTLFNNTVIFKTMIAKMFIETMKLDVDENQVLTACLLCSCKKIDNAQDMERIKSYAKESADFLSKIGFDKNFCKICEQQNRYSGSSPRTKEGDILELADQFGGMLLDRPERQAFPIDEAIILLEYRNLKDQNNLYLENFKQFLEIEIKTIIADNNLKVKSFDPITIIGKYATRDKMVDFLRRTNDIYEIYSKDISKSEKLKDD